jgi:hypothetical protein
MSGEGSQTPQNLAISVVSGGVCSRWVAAYRWRNVGCWVRPAPYAALIDHAVSSKSNESNYFMDSVSDNYEFDPSYPHPTEVEAEYSKAALMPEA